MGTTSAQGKHVGYAKQLFSALDRLLLSGTRVFLHVLPSEQYELKDQFILSYLSLATLFVASRNPPLSPFVIFSASSTASPFLLLS